MHMEPHTRISLLIARERQRERESEKCFTHTTQNRFVWLVLSIFGLLSHSRVFVCRESEKAQCATIQSSLSLSLLIVFQALERGRDIVWIRLESH